MKFVSKAEQEKRQKRKTVIAVACSASFLIGGLYLLNTDHSRSEGIKALQEQTLSSKELRENNKHMNDESSKEEGFDLENISEKSSKTLKGADSHVAEADVVKGNMNYESVSIPTLSEVKEAQKPENIERAKHAMTGTISIPSVDIRLNILEGTNATNMLYGATTMLPHQKMGKGNYVLAGHNMKARGVLFSNLILNDQPQVHKGNRIYLSNGSKTYTYRVTSTETIDMHNTSCLNESKKPIITLFTCTRDTYNTGKTKYRFVVHGELLK